MKRGAGTKAADRLDSRAWSGMAGKGRTPAPLALSRRRLPSFLAGCLLVAWAAAVATRAPASLTQRPYRFDAGGQASTVAEGALPLAPGTSYEAGRGYGWTTEALEAYQRPALKRSRDAFTIDGVKGRAVGFRANVPAGTWWLTLWVEAGLEDSSTVALRLQETPRALGWTAFPVPAEPRTALQKIYRVFHGPVAVDDGELRFTLTAGADSVRLMGFSLFPDPRPDRPHHEAVLQRLQQLGRYQTLRYDPAQQQTVYEALSEATDALDSLAGDLQSLAGADATDAFAAYWKEQAELLVRAERYFARRGWEWANGETGLGLFDRLHQAVMLLDGLLGAPGAEASPLYERALFTRGRLLYWLALERGGERELAGGRRDLAALYARHPEDRLLAMYMGEKVDQADRCDALQYAANAPAWSVAQRETLCRLGDLAHWWVEKQQALNGELGGKLGDDVELLRWWPPLILSGDTVTLAGWKRLADGVWESGQIEEGYAREVSDVEHASEFVSDTAPQMIVFSDDPGYVDRLAYSARHFGDLWTGLSEKGRRYFRSAWFSATEVEAEPPKNRDVEYNTRAAKAVRYYAWKTEEERVRALMHDWAAAWVHAAMRTDKGKPSGLIPASIRFPDEAVNGDEPTWYRANMYWDYFDWVHHAGSMMMDQQLFAYTLTGDSTLLAPLISALELVRRHEDAAQETAEPGSAAWAVTRLRGHEGFWSVAAQWRLFTGATRYDDLLLRYGTPYLRFRISGDEDALVEGLTSVLEAVRYNAPLRTYEAIHTDRVYVTEGDGPGAAHLQAMLTGNGVQESMSPYYAASWQHTGEGFTALVTDTGPETLGAMLFSHGASAQTVALKVWQLVPGTYRLTRRLPEGEAETSTVEITRRGQVIPISLPSRTLLTLHVEKAL